MEENVASRLKVFMDYMGLSNSQFADSCGIPRPTLSQLLSGRNKKISDVLVGQIHQAYPDLSILWLMFGEGSMMASEVPAGKKEVDEIADISIFSDDLSDSENDSKENTLETPFNDTLLADVQKLDPSFNGSITNLQKNDLTQKCRKVIQITVYYDDSTFETFVPK